MIAIVRPAAGDQLPARVVEVIGRFRKGLRRQLRKLARTSPELGDLIVAYPGAAFALATGYGSLEERAAAVRLVKEGHSLRLVGRVLGLPAWLRKLPPEAFIDPLPRFSFSPRFNEKVAHFVARSPDEAWNWLYWVIMANCDAGEEFALWLASKDIFGPPMQNPAQLFPLALYGWYSREPLSEAGRLIDKRWHPKMRYSRALDAATDWLEEIKIELFLGAGGVPDPWLQGGRSGGFRFVPILTKLELEREGEIMQNCVRDYSNAITHGRCRLFSVRRGARHVATLEVQPHPGHRHIPMIVQLFGPANQEAPSGVWKAAFGWLAGQPRFDLPFGEGRDQPAPNVALWRRFWAPYWASRGANRRLPEQPERHTLDRWLDHLAALGERV